MGREAQREGPHLHHSLPECGAARSRGFDLPVDGAFCGARKESSCRGRSDSHGALLGYSATLEEVDPYPRSGAARQSEDLPSYISHDSTYLFAYTAASYVSWFNSLGVRAAPGI